MLKLPPASRLGQPDNLRPLRPAFANRPSLKILLCDFFGKLIRSELGDVFALPAADLDVRGAGVKDGFVGHSPLLIDGRAVASGRTRAFSSRQLWRDTLSFSKGVLTNFWVQPRAKTVVFNGDSIVWVLSD